MRKKLFTLLLTLVTSVAAFATDGVLNSAFTINAEGNQVQFSQGNLQYQASTGTWRFAEKQYDYIGSNNKNISDTYTGWIDLFGWGTSGYDNTSNDQCAIHYLPYSYENDAPNCEEINTTGYGPSTDQDYRGLIETAASYDWGVYNTISNSSEDTEWRTLTYNEWYYLLFSRPNAKTLRSQATISNMHGYVLLPDEWIKPDGIEFTPMANSYTENSYTTAQWAAMEQAGAVFLPAAGERRLNQVGYTNSHGFYWTASANNAKLAYVVHFVDSTLYGSSRYSRNYGHSVRLVHNVNTHTDIQPKKFAGFDVRGGLFGSYIYDNGGFKNTSNLTIEETDSTLHKYTLILTTGKQECSFTLGGVRFTYTNSADGKTAFKTTNNGIQPDGKDRKIIIPTNPGDEILISLADTVQHTNVQVQGIATSTFDFKEGENILQATSDSIVITTSNEKGEQEKIRINAILCLAHHDTQSSLSAPQIQSKANKIIRDGQMYIICDGKMYNLMGQEISR